MALGAAAAVSAKSSDNEFEFTASQKLFSATNYGDEHLGEKRREIDDEIYKSYCVDDEVQWRTDSFSEFSVVEERMEAFNINEPLDLRIHNKRYESD